MNFNKRQYDAAFVERLQDAVLEVFKDQDTEILNLKNEVESLKKENAILKQIIMEQHIDLLNSAVKSTEIDVKEMRGKERSSTKSALMNSINYGFAEEDD